MFEASNNLISIKLANILVTTKTIKLTLLSDKNLYKPEYLNKNPKM